MKTVSTPTYNYVFNPSTGFFARWGETFDDDPVMSPLGPEIADIEITTSCSGPDGKVCRFCYKSNNPNGSYMTFSTFKRVFNNLPRTITQIAFGADATLKSNPDIWRIMKHCRKHNVVPNVTVANIDHLTAWRLSQICGAVAVSRYDDKNLCYDSVQKLSTYGLNQINIHQLLSEETFDNVVETIHDIKRDYRLRNLKAIVFLSLKQKGRGRGYTRLSDQKFKYIIHLAQALGVNYGFDSCSANKFIKTIDQHSRDKLMSSIEPCESTCFSMYVNVNGEFFPCSFAEGNSFEKAGDWTEGIPLTHKVDFLKDVWENRRTEKFRKSLITNKCEHGVRQCPLYQI